MNGNDAFGVGLLIGSAIGIMTGLLAAWGEFQIALDAQPRRQYKCHVCQASLYEHGSYLFCPKGHGRKE